MAEQNPSILSHISLGSNRFDEAVAFYDQVLATLGCKRILEHPGAVAWVFEDAFAAGGGEDMRRGGHRLAER